MAVLALTLVIVLVVMTYRLESPDELVSLNERRSLLTSENLREGMEKLVKHKRGIASVDEDYIIESPSVDGEERDRVELEKVTKELRILQTELENDYKMLEQLLDQGNETNSVYFEDNIVRKKQRINELGERQELLDASLNTQ